MFIFFTVLAVVTAGCCWATERVDRPRRRQLRRELALDQAAAASAR